MKKTIFLGFLFFLLLIPQNTYAHVLQTDKSIGAVLHITPEDDPIIGEQTAFFFEFKDKQNKFNPQNCTCTFSIAEEGRQIYTQPLFQDNQNPSLTNASVFYTFSHKNIYQIKITGEPKGEGAFQPFSLLYDIRVQREPDTKSNNDSQTNVVPFSLVGILVIFAIIILLKYKK